MADEKLLDSAGADPVEMAEIRINALVLKIAGCFDPPTPQAQSVIDSHEGLFGEIKDFFGLKDDAKPNDDSHGGVLDEIKDLFGSKDDAKPNDVSLQEMVEQRLFDFVQYQKDYLIEIEGKSELEALGVVEGVLEKSFAEIEAQMTPSNPAGSLGADALTGTILESQMNLK